jgi:hypothetical protein
MPASAPSRSFSTQSAKSSNWSTAKSAYPPAGDPRLKATSLLNELVLIHLVRTNFLFESDFLNQRGDSRMLRITIELVPGGRESDAQVIGRGWIANTSNLRDLSNYALKFEEHSWQGRYRADSSGEVSGDGATLLGFANPELIDAIRRTDTDLETGHRRILGHRFEAFVIPHTEVFKTT